MTTLIGDFVAPSISIRKLIARFWQQVAFTWLLVLLEGVGFVLLPLVLGKAIDDLLKQSYGGVKLLAALCLLMTVIGAGRRLYDTRVYGGIYRRVGGELVYREKKKTSSISKISARSRLFTEFIQFLEFSIPEISHNFINLFGTLIIIATLNVKVFAVCLGVACFATFIYWISGGKIHRLNKGENDELECQVQCVESGEQRDVENHFKRLIDWRIRLSDLETLNFTGVWLGLSIALVSSVVFLGGSSDVDVGVTLSILMYVFGFVESVIAFPSYYQQVIRLQEIASRFQ